MHAIIINYMQKHNWVNGVVTLLLLLVVAVLAYHVTKWITNHYIRPNLKKLSNQYLQDISHYLKGSLVGNISFAVVFRLTSSFIDEHPFAYSKYVINIINKLSMLYLFIVLLLLMTNMIHAVNRYYMRSVYNAKFYSIKPYLNILICLIWVFGLIFIVAYFSNTSLVTVFAGLSALSAVFLLLFKDTLLGIVSSIQASISNIVQIGDRIEIERHNLLGIVLDISITSVRVRSADNITLTIPTYMLTSEVVKNYRSIQKYNARRIKKVLHIDINSVRSLTTEEVVQLDKLKLLRQEDESGNMTRVVTNIELFRLYLENYLRSVSYIRQDELLVVYQHSPTANGIPVEIYAYATLTGFVEFQHLQSRIIAHAIVTMREFGLVAFQNQLPSV